MFGAITGDILGSPYEGTYPTELFEGYFHPKCRVTDDTILTVATMDILTSNLEPAQTYRLYALKYTEHTPDTSKIGREQGRTLSSGRKEGRTLCPGYGPQFQQWASSSEVLARPSRGNGCVMRISPLACAANHGNWPVLQVLAEAERLTLSTHKDAVAVKATQVYVLALLTLLNAPAQPWEQVEQFVLDHLPGVEDYLGREFTWLDTELRVNWLADAAVKLAMCVVRDADSYEQAVKRAILIGGDTDTTACIAGALAEARFGLPLEMLERTKEFVPTELLNVTKRFYKTFPTAIQSPQVSQVGAASCKTGPAVNQSSQVSQVGAASRKTGIFTWMKGIFGR